MFQMLLIGATRMSIKNKNALCRDVESFEFANIFLSFKIYSKAENKNS